MIVASVGLLGTKGSSHLRRSRGQDWHTGRPQGHRKAAPSRVFILLVCLGASRSAGAGVTGGAGDLVRFAPPDSQAAVRGREVAARFDLGRRFELSLQVNNAFAAQNRVGIARAESLISAIPGVRKVIGPAGLLALSVDAAGRASSGPLLAGGPGDDASEAVRQRLVRRSDAVGWFISRDGTEIRLLVDTDDFPSVRSAIETAAASSGLVLLSGGVPAQPLWPEPDREPHPFPPWLPFELVALAMLVPGLVVAARARPSIPRAFLCLGGAGIAAAATGFLAPAVGLRHAAWAAGIGAAALLAVLMILARVVAASRSGQWESVRLKAPIAIVGPSLLLVLAVAVAVPRIVLGTQLWHQTSVFFVSVRGDMDEPVVMREVRRLTEFLRSRPGVAHSWSIADLFFAVPRAGEEIPGVPDTRELMHTILTRARDDSAVHLELGPDHGEALVGVRLDAESGVDRLVVLGDLERYLGGDHRSALLRVDVSDPNTTPSLRTLGRGILAADDRERVLRICARSGRNLNPPESQAVERAARRAALMPTVDPAKLKSEVSQEVNDFLEEMAIAESHVGLPRPSERLRLAGELAGEPVNATVTDVLTSLRGVWSDRLSVSALGAQASELRRRIAAVRRRHIARINFNDILYGADLPTEGVLSEEIRAATMEAMGPLVGIPVPRNAPGALLVDAAAIGGPACDRALSDAWRPRLGWGILIAAAVTALLLVVIGGGAALGWWPVAMAPGAALLLVPAIGVVPVGVLYLSVLAGASAGGAAFAIAFAPGRRDL